MVVGRAGGRRDTPRRTGNEGRNVVAVATPSCAVGRPRHAPTSRDAASGLRAVAPVCGAIGVTCAPAHSGTARVQWQRGGEGEWGRGMNASRARCNFQSTRRGHRLFGAPHRDVSIIDSRTLHYSIFRFHHGELTVAFQRRRVKIDV